MTTTTGDAAVEPARRLDAYLVCGGRWHDFDFARLQILRQLAKHENVRTRVGEDYSNLEAIASADILVTYTCDVRPTQEQQRVLVDYVHRGGRWFALHGTNAALERDSDGRFVAPRVLGEVARVLGSQFAAHPPIQPYIVEPVSDHPLVHGIGEFETDDELYLSTFYDLADTQVLLETRWSGDSGDGFAERLWFDDERRPVMYLHRYGEGEVLYLTLGHCRGHYDMTDLVGYYPKVERGSWAHPAFHELVRRSVAWAIGTHAGAETKELNRR